MCQLVGKLSSGHRTKKGLPNGPEGKESTCNARDLGTVPEFGRSPGEWNGNPLQYSCLGKSKDRGAWQATVHGGHKELDTTEATYHANMLDHRQSRDFQRNIYFCFIDYLKAFDCVDHNKLWKILKETGMPDHLTCLLRNLYAAQEVTVRTRHGTMDWFKIGKRVCQGCILSPSLFNLYAEWMQNARLDEGSAGIKIAVRNINNLRYADDIMLMAESEEELKGLFMGMKEESEKAGLKQHLKN